MRILIGALAVALSAGCTTAGLQEQSAVFTGNSKKSPLQYSRCLAPKWQDINSSTSSLETETGYRISASAAFTGVVALAVVSAKGGGSNVSIYLPSDWAGTSGWKSSAQSCI